MISDFYITSPKDKKDLENLKKFMLKQPQFYPKYKEWVSDICIPGIEKQNRKAIIVLSSNEVIGEVVYREISSGTEIKNFRVDPSYRKRDLGRFLLKQVENQSNQNSLLLDVTVNNLKGVGFFIRQGFWPIEIKELYKKGQSEYIMQKKI
jgi:ribosomal protein S18 acetylase RimI-like enzyme